MRPRIATGHLAADRLAEARALRRSGRLDRAEALAQKALRRDPRDAEALHLLALIAQDRHRQPRALQLLEKAAKAAPDSPAVLCDLGLAYKAAGRMGEAVECQRRVVERMPQSALAHSNLGTALAAAGRFHDALAALAIAASLAPDQAEIAYNQGNALLALGCWRDAEDAFRRALERDRAHIRAQLNLGVALKEQGRLNEAIPILRAVTAANPQWQDAEWNLALALLLDGQWFEGWRAHEVRRRLPGFAIHKIDAAPWDGGPLHGRTLLVHAEQGLGDTIQFCRWLQRLGRMDGEVVFRPPEALRPLLATLDIPVRIAARGERLAADLEAPLMSLPTLVGPVEPFWPEAGPYLAVEAKRLARWRERLAPYGGRTIAISWQGNPDFRNDRRRSIPLAAFAPLAALPGIRLISLQRGFGQEQIATVPWRDRIVETGPATDADGAFLDTAAIARAADLVIACDTSIAHLAGAVGARVWLPLCDAPDWRWGLNGETTPWYPTMRLWRQTATADWAGVFHRIAAEVARWTA